MNIQFVRACARGLGANEGTVTTLEKTEHRERNEWDEHQAQRWWGRMWTHADGEALGIDQPGPLRKGYAFDLSTCDVREISQCGPKVVTVVRLWGAGGQQSKAEHVNGQFAMIPEGKLEAARAFSVAWKAALSITTNGQNHTRAARVVLCRELRDQGLAEI